MTAQRPAREDAAERSSTIRSASLTQVAGLPIADEALAAEVTSGLGQVEELLRREVHSNYRFVDDTSLHLIEAGGKRFRPLLTLLAVPCLYLLLMKVRPEETA